MLFFKATCSTYRQHIRQPDLQQIDVEGHIRTCDVGNCKIMLFLQFGKTTKYQEKHIRHVILKNLNLR